MSARDELAKLIESGYAGDDSDCPYEHAPSIADAILAAGYSKPRTITTAEELDALATGSVVVLRDSKGDPHPAQKGDYGWRLPFVDRFWEAEKLMAGGESAEVIP